MALKLWCARPCTCSELSTRALRVILMPALLRPRQRGWRYGTWLWLIRNPSKTRGGCCALVARPRCTQCTHTTTGPWLSVVSSLAPRAAALRSTTRSLRAMKHRILAARWTVGALCESITARSHTTVRNGVEPCRAVQDSAASLQLKKCTMHGWNKSTFL